MALIGTTIIPLSDENYTLTEYSKYLGQSELEREMEEDPYDEVEITEVDNWKELHRMYLHHKSLSRNLKLLHLIYCEKDISGYSTQTDPSFPR